MRKIGYFAFFFLVCLTIALLFTMPVQHVLPYAKLPNTVRLTGINGSIFKGNVRHVTVNSISLTKVDYRFRPHCMFFLETCYHIRYDRGESSVAYDWLDGSTEANRTRATYQANDLATQFPGLLVSPIGQVELSIDNMTLVQGKLLQVNGQLVWRELGFEEQGGDLGLGDYQLDFSGGTQGYRFKIKDLDAGLKVDGDGAVNPSGQYTLDIKISSESAIDPKIKNVLDLFAKSTAYNKYRVEKNGRLPPQLIRQLF